MKRFLIVPLLFLLLFGCSQVKETTPILNNISFAAQISYGENEYSCDASIIDDVLNLTVTEPQEINGLSLTFDKSSLTAEFKGVSFNPDINTLPQGAAVQILFDVFNDVTNNKKVKCDGQNCVIDGMVGDYEYGFIFAPSGFPISLEIDDLDLSIKFKNVTVI